MASSTHTDLSALPPKLRKAIEELYEHLFNVEKPHHRHAFFKCPVNARHQALYTYTWFHGMEMVHCHGCGLRFVMHKAEGQQPKLVNHAEYKESPPLRVRIKDEPEAAPPKPKRIRS